jgi:hypothetical protein
MLRAQYDFAEPLPERLKNLLNRLENADKSADLELQCMSCPRAVQGQSQTEAGTGILNEAL